MALFYSTVPLSHDSATVSLHVEYKDPESEAAKLFTPLFFPIVTCQIVKKVYADKWVTVSAI